jgi:hypothetical protein
MNITPDRLTTALTTFIKSGSANGNESMRRECLRLVPAFSFATEMIDLLKAISLYFQDTDAPMGNKARAILKQIEG